MKIKLNTEFSASEGVFAILPVLIFQWDCNTYSIGFGWMRWGGSIIFELDK